MDNKNKTKIVFWGTPAFAVPFLESLIKDNDFEVIGLVTQPDKPSGRKQTVTPPPTKVFAEKNKINVLQPNSVKNNSEIVDQLKNWQPDLFVVVAYGEIIPKVILDIPQFGVVNVHPSLLPKYRGASPVQAAILNGDKTTGVSIMLLDEKMDHGPILAAKEVNLDQTETNESLHQKLAEVGRSFLIETLKNFLAKEIKPQEQKHDQAVYCREVKKEEAKINWSETAETIEKMIRAFYFWPIAWTIWQNKRIKIFPPVEIKKSIKQETKKLVGKITFENDQLLVNCGQDFLAINKLQIEGKKETSAKNFVLGNQEIIDSVLD